MSAAAWICIVMWASLCLGSAHSASNEQDPCSSQLPKLISDAWDLRAALNDIAAAALAPVSVECPPPSFIISIEVGIWF